MGEPRKHIPVKLIVGLISSKPARFIAAKRILEKKFGEIDNETGILDFACTRYYEKEIGDNLKREFFSFKKLIALGGDYRIKLYTNRVERRLSRERRRTVNIDPGYITLANLVLWTTKNRSHRVYLGAGIYADLELMFVRKSFRALQWTYPDYRTKGYISFFNSVRERYLEEIKSYL